MKDLLKDIDYFGYKIEFMVDKRDRFTTVSGCIITIIFAIFSLLYFSYSSINLLNRDNYMVTTNFKLGSQECLGLEQLDIGFKLYNKKSQRMNSIINLR